MPGVGFVFWNLFRKPLAGRVADLTRETGADVVVLTEVTSPADEFRSALAVHGDFHVISDPLSTGTVVLCRVVDL